MTSAESIAGRTTVSLEQVCELLQGFIAEQRSKDELIHREMSAVLRKYEINKETYRQRFRDGAVRANETPKELYTRLKGLYEKWMTPHEKTKEQIGDTIIMEQYLKMVNPELRSWIIECSPTSTDQAVTLAEAYIAARQAEGKFRSRIMLKLW
uniref:SCAN box domain-containing protein n=1 Tax=Pygocentrus nattereri TaxID=42514 RepID=A0AAR2KTM4_PYGNA